jgi:hypothetical protein
MLRARRDQTQHNALDQLLEQQKAWFNDMILEEFKASEQYQHTTSGIQYFEHLSKRIDTFNAELTAINNLPQLKARIAEIKIILTPSSQLRSLADQTLSKLSGAKTSPLNDIKNIVEQHYKNINGGKSTEKEAFIQLYDLLKTNLNKTNPNPSIKSILDDNKSDYDALLRSASPAVTKKR